MRDWRLNVWGIFRGKCVLLNRGFADDVVKNEHIQLFYNDKFLARAYSASRYYRSVWLIYQIVNEALK